MGDEQFKRIERDNGLLKSHIQKQCEKLGLRTNIGHFNVDMLQNSKILVDDKHKVGSVIILDIDVVLFTGICKSNLLPIN